MPSAKALVFTMNNAHARARLYRGLHLLVRLCGSQLIAADMLGCHRVTIRNAFTEGNTRITLERVKRAARSYLLDVKDDFEAAEFSACQAIVRMIDPTAEVAYKSGASVDKFPDVVHKFLVDRWDRPLAAAVHHYAARDFQPKYIRQVIKRLVKKYPELAMRDIDPEDTTPDDVVNRFHVSIKKVGDKPKKVSPQKASPPAVTTPIKKTKLTKPVITPPPVKRKKPAAAKPQSKAPAVKPVQTDLFDVADKGQVSVEPGEKRFDLGPPERNVIEEIAERGTSQAVKDRVAKLLGLST